MMPGALLFLLVAANDALVFVDPPAPRLGELVVIYLEHRDPKVRSVRGVWLEYEVVLFRVSADRLRGVAAVPLDTEPGPHRMVFNLGEGTVQTAVQVLGRTFDASELKVGRRFTKKKSKKLRARLRRESRAFRSIFSGAPRGPTFIGRPVAPTDTPVTGLFGTQRVFNGVRQSTHYGLDLNGQVGDPVHTVLPGWVALSDDRWGSGHTVVVDHGGGLFTGYYHLSTRLVAPDQWVKKGRIIGKVGATGRVTGPHLHLAVMIRAARVGKSSSSPRPLYIDPEGFLVQTFAGDPRFLEGPTKRSPQSATERLFGGGQ